MEKKETLHASLEALIFASPKAISASEMEEILKEEEVTTEEVSEALSELVKKYAEGSYGFFIELTATGEYQFRTKQEFSPILERLFQAKPRTLSRAAQETLAIIAYRQPVTRVDIEFIRGVDAGSIIKNLLDRGLIKCVGRKEEVGRPMLFGTTQDFLRVFQISKLSDLPPLESFQPSKETMGTALEKIAGNESADVL